VLVASEGRRACRYGYLTDDPVKLAAPEISHRLDAVIRRSEKRRRMDEPEVSDLLDMASLTSLTAMTQTACLIVLFIASGTAPWGGSLVAEERYHRSPRPDSPLFTLQLAAA
jgi:hypothetical protein